MSLINSLNDRLREIEGGNVSGGGTTWKDMEFFQKVRKDESIIWHHTKWIQSKLDDDEEIQLMTIMRWRKRPKHSLPTKRSK